MVLCACRSALLKPPQALDTGCRPRVSPRVDEAPRPSGEPDIGMVVFTTHRAERAEAILDSGGAWRCPGLPVLDRVLNALYEPAETAGDGMPFGHAELIRVAAWLKGEARYDRPRASGT